MSSKIFALIPKIMADLGAIKKDKTNTHQNYKFRGIEDMYNSIHPILVKHSVFCAPQIVDRTSESHEGRNAKGEAKLSHRVTITVNHRFYADDGSFIDVVTAGEGIDTSDKATNKAMSAAMKYAFIELFSIPTQDIEDSESKGEEIDADQTNKIQAPPKKPSGFAPRTFGAKQ